MNDDFWAFANEKKKTGCKVCRSEHREEIDGYLRQGAALSMLITWLEKTNRLSASVETLRRHRNKCLV